MDKTAIELAAEANKYAGELFSIAIRNAFDTEAGYALHRVGRPDNNQSENYFPTSHTPAVISALFKQIATSDTLPLFASDKEAFLGRLESVVGTLEKVNKLPCDLRYVSSLGNTIGCLRGHRGHNGSLEQIKTSLETIAQRLG